MIEKSKKQKTGGIFTENDLHSLLRRYSASTVLKLLQEVAQFDDRVNLDWKALVEKTNTGISNAREYQLLWRHLAYRHALPEIFDNNSDPLDDDSDLEFEVEAFPGVSSEATKEAAVCVKVLVASGQPSDSSHPVGTMIEASLTTNIPNDLSMKSTSENVQPSVTRELNIRVPDSMEKQPMPAATSAEGSDADVSARGTLPPKKKRKIWTEKDDMALIASVQRYGEHNWVKISREDFKGNVAPAQLSKKWATIRRKQRILNLKANLSGLQLVEEQRAARYAMNMALDGVGNSGDPNPIRAAAIAAGAQIAPQSSVELLRKAAQSKNAIHIKAAGACSLKPFMPQSAATNLETCLSSASLAAPAISHSPDVALISSHHSSIKPSTPATHHTSSEQGNAGLTLEQEAKIAEKIEVYESGNSISAPKDHVQRDGSCLSGNELCKKVQEIEVALPTQEVESKTQAVAMENLSGSQELEEYINHMRNELALNAEMSQIINNLFFSLQENGNQPAPMGIENEKTGDKQADSCGKKSDDRSEKPRQ